MNYFLCITTEENAKIIMDTKIWGVSKKYKNTISKVNMGDRLIIYEMGKQKTKNREEKPQYIRAIYESVSGIIEDNKKIFESHPNNPSEVYPFRIKLKEVKMFEKPIIFKKLVPEMEFIKNKIYWAGSFRRAMVQIGERDYKKIFNE